MIPPLIVAEALRKGLDILAITDHNATANAPAVRQAAEGTPLTVLLGMELQTREEVDVLCLFETPNALRAWQRFVDARLPPLTNDAAHFGPQYVVDAEGEFIREEPRLLQAATTLGLEEAAREVHRRGGLVIPAHIDRLSHGLMGMLGLWPSTLEADAAEVSPNMRPSQARKAFPSLPTTLALISSSDAHWLDQIGRALTIFELEGPPTLDALRQALRSAPPRHVYVP